MSEARKPDPSAATRYARAKGVKLKRVGEATAVYVGEQKAIHVLNSTAELIYRCLETPRTLADLATLVEELTDAGPETIERDLRRFVPELIRLRLVERVE